MTTDDLAALLAEHSSLFASMSANQYVCSGCREYIGPLYYKTATRTLAAHQAAIIAAAGWVRGREEFGVTDTGDGGVDEIEPPTREWASRVAAANNAHLRRNGMEGESIVVRRYVTDWEEVPRET